MSTLQLAKVVLAMKLAKVTSFEQEMNSTAAGCAASAASSLGHKADLTNSSSASRCKLKAACAGEVGLTLNGAKEKRALTEAGQTGGRAHLEVDIIQEGAAEGFPSCSSCEKAGK